MGIVISSPKSWEFVSPGHPESPERTKHSYTYLKKQKFKLVEPQICSEDDIARVHNINLISNVKLAKFYDGDTPALPNIYYYASLSAGAAIRAMEYALEGTKSFSLMRPPGHHAGISRLGGFCYFNNLAIAVMKAIHTRNINKVAILDFDVHHGNGTQDIFLNHPNAFFVSLHQSPLFPGTGLESEKNCVNFSLPTETTETTYLNKITEALGLIRKYQPQLLAISAGFDTYEKDPLANFGLHIETYRTIGQAIADLELPSFAVLEGGYSTDLPKCVEAFLNGFFAGPNIK